MAVMGKKVDKKNRVRGDMGKVCAWVLGRVRGGVGGAWKWWGGGVEESGLTSAGCKQGQKTPSRLLPEFKGHRRVGSMCTYE